MSVRIAIEITEKPESRSLDIARKVEGSEATAFEKKMAVYYLLGLGRGLANFGIEQNNSDLLGSAADFVAAAEKIFREAKPEERGA